MRKIYFPVLIIFFAGLAGCHSKVISSSGSEPVTFAAFREMFPALTLPYMLTADSLNRPFPDSPRVKPEIVRRFFPDSLNAALSGKEGKARCFPLGRFSHSGLDYLLLKVSDAGSRRIYLAIFDEDGKYLNRLLLAGTAGRSPDIVTSAKIDKRAVITVSEMHGDISQPYTKENVYTVNPDGSLMLVLTTANEPMDLSEITNPIDTLGRQHKYSADYLSGKKSILSVRDGQQPGTFRFFIHFYKAAGDCSGEIDGTGKLSGNTGEYREEAAPVPSVFILPAILLPSGKQEDAVLTGASNVPLTALTGRPKQ